MEQQKAIFGAGCFWGIEERFRTTPGVLSTRVGYTGGLINNPTYDDVCSGESRHTEVVEVTFDSGLINYKELLEIFWESHNPTQQNRQGPDIGSQYRSAIFYLNAEQKFIAEESLKLNQSKVQKPIVTEIVEASEFYEAEEYHQQYLAKRGKSVCHY